MKVGQGRSRGSMMVKVRLAWPRMVKDVSQGWLRVIKESQGWFRKTKVPPEFKYGIRMFQVCFKYASSMLQACVKHVSSMLQECFKYASSMNQ